MLTTSEGEDLRTSLAGANVGEIVRTQRAGMAQRTIAAWKNWERLLHQVFFGDKFYLVEHMGHHGRQMVQNQMEKITPGSWLANRP
eukprot:506426-Prymnesium_polylepis.1